MNSKVADLGLFMLWVGVLLAALTGIILQGARVPSSTVAVAVIPGAVMAVTGGLVLARRSRGAVLLMLGLVSLAFVGDAVLAVLSADVIRPTVAGVVLCIVWIWGTLALRELSSRPAGGADSPLSGKGPDFGTMFQAFVDRDYPGCLVMYPEIVRNFPQLGVMILPFQLSLISMQRMGLGNSRADGRVVCRARGVLSRARSPGRPHSP